MATRTLTSNDLEDIKQIIDVAVSRSESRLEEKIDAKIDSKIDSLRQEMLDGFAGIGDILTPLIERVDRHDEEIIKLKRFVGYFR